MTWTEPERPEWVRVANAGKILPMAEEAGLPLTIDALLGEAAARQGHALRSLSDIETLFGHNRFPASPALERLKQFLRAIDEEAHLHIMGRVMARRFLLRLLEVRLQIMAYLRADPDVQSEQIDAPLFVAGAPRTGTTILHRLLASDPRHRVPEGWELLRPVPPPSPAPALFAADPRIELANRELIGPQTVVQGLLSIHEYGARRPKECLSAQSFAFQSEEFTARFAVPSFEALLKSSDMRDAYQMHRLVLQILQRGHGSTSWVLKSPVHLHQLPILFETYPDAQVALTHRDPLTLLSSLTSLIASLRWSHSDTVDPVAIAREHVERYARSFERLVDWDAMGELPTRQIHHSHFADFQSAPFETTSALYEAFGRQLPPDAAEQMRAALEASPADEHGTHRYSREELGEDEEALRKRFARYQTRFEVPSDD